MEFDTASLFASMLIGTVGFGLFLFGKKQQRIPQLVCGVVFMVYPYFVPGALLSSLIAVALLGVLWLAVKQGM